MNEYSIDYYIIVQINTLLTEKLQPTIRKNKSIESLSFIELVKVHTIISVISWIILFNLVFGCNEWSVLSQKYKTLLIEYSVDKLSFTDNFY